MLASQIGLNFATHISFIFVLLIPFEFASSVMRVVVAHLLLQRVSPREKGEVLEMGQSSIALARIASPQLAGLAMEHSTMLPGTIEIAFAALASGLIYKRTALYIVTRAQSSSALCCYTTCASCHVCIGPCGFTSVVGRRTGHESTVHRVKQKKD